VVGVPVFDVQVDTLA